MISIVNQLSYNNKKIIANNQSINANTDGIKSRARKFYNNIMIRYVSKVMVEYHPYYFNYAYYFSFKLWNI
jgi:hypothetical protein